jgi:hypothetical protein
LGAEQAISTAATGPGSIIQGHFGDEHNNFEVVVLEGNELVHYWHHNVDVGLPWWRARGVAWFWGGAN